MEVNRSTKKTYLGLGTMLLLITFITCSRKNSPLTSSSYLPKFLKGISLEQEQKMVLQLRPKAYAVNSLLSTPWQQFSEDIKNASCTSISYFFEKTEHKNLVAIELLYQDEISATSAFKNFGGTNSNNTSHERIRWHQTQGKIYALQNHKRITFCLAKAHPSTSSSPYQ